MPIKVLLVEDEAALRQAVTESLGQAGYLVEVTANFRQAREKIAFYQYDCVLLDLALPDSDGLDLLWELKADNSQAGMLILTAHNRLADCINGLDHGGGGYLVKPFHLSKLNVRIRSIIQRRQLQGQQYLAFRDLVVWPGRNEVLVQGEPFALTRKEYGLLLYFLANPGRLLTKEAIAEHLCGDQVEALYSLDFIYTHLKNLRKKLQEHGVDNYIRTLYGVGYKLSTY